MSKESGLAESYPMSKNVEPEAGFRTGIEQEVWKRKPLNCLNTGMSSRIIAMKSAIEITRPVHPAGETLLFFLS